jgi:drug/metabolite transporter (DMT)-like permease
LIPDNATELENTIALLKKVKSSVPRIEASQSAFRISELDSQAATQARSAFSLSVAGLVLLGALAATGQSLRPRVGLATIGWLALTQSMLFYGATFWGILHAGAGLAAVLANTDPLFVAALASVLLGEYLTRRQWLGLVVGMVGATVVVWQGPIWPPALSGGALSVVAGAFACSVGTVVASRGVGADASPVALAGGQRGVGGAIPFALFYLALARAPATQVSTWFFLIPVVGVLSAWLLLGVQPTLQLLVGLAAVSVGLWLVLATRTPGRELLVDSRPPL